jgi:hypothetical protein
MKHRHARTRTPAPILTLSQTHGVNTRSCIHVCLQYFCKCRSACAWTCRLTHTARTGARRAGAPDEPSDGTWNLVLGSDAWPREAGPGDSRHSPGLQRSKNGTETTTGREHTPHATHGHARLHDLDTVNACNINMSLRCARAVRARLSAAYTSEGRAGNLKFRRWFLPVSGQNRSPHTILQEII